MITGIGIDIVAIERIEKIQKKGNLNQLMQRILRSEEISKLNEKHNPSESLTNQNQVKTLAKRFAAKEALSKALGVGIGIRFSFQDVSVVNDKKGKPEFKASGKLEDWLVKENLKLFLSLSDEKNYAVAMVIIEQL